MAWHVKATGAYGRQSNEALENAREIYGLLYSLGWCLASVCALLGNVEHESGYNPWRWQSDVVLPVGDSRIGTIGGSSTAHAYGLCQQDPAAKYIYRQYAQSLPYFGPNYSNQTGNTNDGDPQLRYIHWICSDPSGGEWQSSGGWGASYKMPFADFIANTQNQSLGFLTQTFFYGYERGTWSDTRITAATYWYEVLGGEPPQPPTPPSGLDPAWAAVLYYVTKKHGGNLVLQRGMFDLK